MEDCKDANFMCKYCNKKYSSGKSLGGHLKSHKIPRSLNEIKGRVMIKTDDEMEGQSGEGKSKRKLGFEDGDNESFGYGLRENPKKTRRFAGELGGIVLEKEMMKCKTCGKGFQNMKALCGHMACHSKAKSNGITQDGIELGSEKKKLVIDGPFRAEKSSSVGKSKSGTRRCWNADVRPDEDSSSLSEIEKELEGLARCLIMLSRDDGKRGILRSLSDLSDKKLTAKEVKPSSKSKNARAAGVKGLRCGSKDVKLSGRKKLGNSEVKSAVQCSVNRKKDEHVHLLSGKVDSHSSIDDLTKIRELKEPKKKLRPKAVDMDVKVKVKKNCCKVGHKSEKENCMIGEEVSSKPVNFDCQSHGHHYFDHNDLSYSSFHMDICGSAQILDSKCKCLTFDKVIDSSKTWEEQISCQISSTKSLCSNHGIATNNHKTDSSDFPALNPTDETFDFQSGNDDMIKKFPSILLKSVPVKKSQGHECPICLHIFHSAQALDSHKRSHFSGVSKEKEDHELANEVPPMLIDLNLPAAVEEDSNAADARIFPL